MYNLFANMPDHIPEELVQTLAESPGFKIERIISRGHASPEGFWYDQDQHEWVVILAGSATLRFQKNKQLLTLSPGDYINIPAHQKHRVESTNLDTPTIWLAIHYN